MSVATTEHPATAEVRTEHFDTIVVGAGLSGIAAEYHLQTQLPNKSYLIIEGRESIGGTWDLFRYPGIRSDSDMYTLGYQFAPWSASKAIAPGPDILNYIRDTASKHGIDAKIRFGQRAVSANWSSTDQRWTLDVTSGPDKVPVRYTCSFLFMCSGYYNYSAGYTPEWTDFDRYRGTIVHPQQWPEHLDYAGKRVIVIGSGATAVTLAPEMARVASHVTMLQRSPTYIFSRAAEDVAANWLKEKFPGKLGRGLARWKNILLSMTFYGLSRKRPELIKKLIRKGAQRQIGPDFDIDTHLTPTYAPWDQRMCLVPDGDLFKAIRSGAVSIVTDHIERFTETGILLKSGKTLEADVIVTATGLNMQLMGGMKIAVDGDTIDLGKSLSYKGMMYSDVPNLASSFGYTNASWTLKCELIAKHVCRLLKYMDKRGLASATPRRDASLTEEASLDLQSGYVLRAQGVLPKQGSRQPWKLYQNYLRDIALLRYGKVPHSALEFAKRKRTKKARSAKLARRSA